MSFLTVFNFYVVPLSANISQFSFFMDTKISFILTAFDRKTKNILN